MPTRQTLTHTPPSFIPDGVWFFITICCELRHQNQLCLPSLSAALLADAARYHHQTSWRLHLFLLMPDHLHAILAFPPGTAMATTIGNWKRLTARLHGVHWQRNFFDHRLRPEDGFELKSRYIRENPVRAGLVAHQGDWPHWIDFRSLEGG